MGVAGFGATKLMGKATTAMNEQQTDVAKQQEKDQSYGVAYIIAAKKTAALAGKLGVGLMRVMATVPQSAAAPVLARLAVDRPVAGSEGCPLTGVES